MLFNAEVKNSNTKTKKDGDYKYKVTEVTVEVMRVSEEVVNFVNEQVRVKMHDVSFFGMVNAVNVGIKKLNKIPYRNFKIKIEFEGTNDKIAHLVNKCVDVEINE